jgi:hypothetical protein
LKRLSKTSRLPYLLKIVLNFKKKMSQTKLKKVSAKSKKRM